MLTDKFIFYTILFLGPLLSAAISQRTKKHELFRDIANILIVTLIFLDLGLMSLYLYNGNNLAISWFDIFPGLELSFAIEPIGLVFALFSTFLWLITLLYSRFYFSQDDRAIRTRFYLYTALAMEAVYMMAFASNLLLMWLFYEVLTLVTFPLIILYKNPETIKAARKYLAMLLGASLLLFLPAILLVNSYSSNLMLTPGLPLLHDTSMSQSTLILIFLLFLFGSAKAALFPLHSWLPAAMAAPIPVSGLLHGVAVVKAGICVILKIMVYVFGLDLMSANFESLPHLGGNLLTYIAGATIIYASIQAIMANKLKLILAYSTISNLAVCIISASTFTPIGIKAAVLMMAAHGFAKILAFFSIGYFYILAKIEDLDGLKGQWKAAPLASVAFVISAFSLVGVPYFAGADAKSLILYAASEGQNTPATAFIWIASLASIVYYYRIIHSLYFSKSKDIKQINNSKLANFVFSVNMLALLLFVNFAYISLQILDRIIF